MGVFSKAWNKTSSIPPSMSMEHTDKDKDRRHHQLNDRMGYFSPSRNTSSIRKSLSLDEEKINYTSSKQRHHARLVKPPSLTRKKEEKHIHNNNLSVEEKNNTSITSMTKTIQKKR